MKTPGGNHVTHGGARFLQTGILPKGKEHIAGLVDGVINEMIIDLGGESGITAGQKIIIANIRQLLVFLGLVNEWISQQPSIINSKGDMLAPLNGFYLAASNSVVRNCERLGLKRVSPADDLESYLKRNYGKGKVKDSSAAAVKAPDTLTKGALAKKIGAPGAACEGMEK